MDEKRYDYKGFTVVTGNYIGSGKYFWALEKAGVEVFSTLRSDDKSWNSHEHASEAAKAHIDEILRSRHARR